jgi:hypothetical protein
MDIKQNVNWIKIVWNKIERLNFVVTVTVHTLYISDGNINFSDKAK